MINPVYFARKHALNMQGKRLKKKYIVFESDDWGSERIPDRKSLEFLQNNEFDIYSNPHNYLDSLETEDDLAALYDTLLKFRDRHGNYPVITANSVTANPDFDKIRSSGFREYHFEGTTETYSRKSECKHCSKLIHEGIARNIYHPQFHGREHLNTIQWLSALISGDPILLKAFDAGIYCLDMESDRNPRSNFMASFDGTSMEAELEHEGNIRTGMQMFRDQFGYNSESFIAPCYVWNSSLEPVLKNAGIQYLQGLPIQYVPSVSDRYGKIYHFQGERNKSGQIYFVRNCFFEPSLNPKFNWIKDCLNRIRIIFFWGKPVIIGTHRINFIGTLDENNRRKNLNELAILLKAILKSWPDVEFTTTDDLGKKYDN